jgi:hypothetical protein
MTSNEDQTAYGPRTELQPNLRPNVVDETLKADQVQIERKTFIFSLRENLRGRLLRITEEAQGRRNSVIIPATGLEEFCQVLEEMAKASNELPPKA